MFTKQDIEAKIAALEIERMQHFGNWQRCESALYVWREVLVGLDIPAPVPAVNGAQQQPVLTLVEEKG